MLKNEKYCLNKILQQSKKFLWVQKIFSLGVPKNGKYCSPEILNYTVIALYEHE